MSAPNSDGAHDPLADALASTVRAHPTRRVPLAVLRQAFARFDPTGATDTRARERLAAAVAFLAETGRARVPASRGRWDATMTPPLPLWVDRPAAPAPATAPLPARVWRAELTAAAALIRTPADADVLERVNRFLHEGGTELPLVPHRERSLRVFGHEKTLDGLLRTRLFVSGALSLEMLRCYAAPLPLTAQHTGDAGPSPVLLIAENHSTYASLLDEARRRSASGPSLAVGYGAGNQLPSSIGGAAQLHPRPARIVYFGDLDRKGLEIPVAADAAAQRLGLPPVEPARVLYRALLGERLAEPPSPARALAAGAADALAAWLGDDDLTSRASALLRSGGRAAQEAVGLAELRRLDSLI